jgi:gas vesicle protein
MEDSGMVKGLVIGLLAGMLLGAAVGILYAPKSGAETREILGEKVTEAKEKAGEIFEKVKDQAKKIRGGEQTA